MATILWLNIGVNVWVFQFYIHVHTACLYVAVICKYKIFYVFLNNVSYLNILLFFIYYTIYERCLLYCEIKSYFVFHEETLAHGISF